LEENINTVKNKTAILLLASKENELEVNRFENRALTRIFGPKIKEELGGWRRLLNERTNNL
jgi:hypothetical protein